MEQSSTRWQSYVDGRCLDDPSIDNIALKFVKKMMQPRRKRFRVEADKIPVLTPQKRLVLKLTWALNLMDAEQKCMVFIMVLLSLNYFVLVMLSDPVKTADLKDLHKSQK
ncbi:hypothetical protein DPMN_137115 [Dreissena polymorpha]|uniref:Uncharacterized protein n=3 Tax=Dreissena polymorpha TaxID=45954 RepID=A0A9D4G773_DREPO|nr:hypothetical protein DPMN_137115 [Dreissena polymorpha]